MDIHKETELIQQIWPEWQLRGVKSTRTQGSVYHAEQGKDSFSRKAAIKSIRFPSVPPATQPGMTEAQFSNAVRQYYKPSLQSFMNELKAFNELKSTGAVINLMDYKILEKDEYPGWIVLVCTEDLPTLEESTKDQMLNEHGLLLLASDVGRAISLCHKSGVVHLNIRENNIFISDHNTFKLGDPFDLRDTGSIFEAIKGTPESLYLPPELRQGGNYSYNADVYSLGVVLYKLINGNRPPKYTKESLSAGGFPVRPELNDVQEISGEFLQIVLNACNADPMKRYSSIDAMMVDVNRYGVKLSNMDGSSDAGYSEDVASSSASAMASAGAASAMGAMAPQVGAMRTSGQSSSGFASSDFGSMGMGSSAAAKTSQYSGQTPAYSGSTQGQSAQGIPKPIQGISQAASNSAVRPGSATARMQAAMNRSSGSQGAASTGMGYESYGDSGSNYYSSSASASSTSAPLGLTNPEADSITKSKGRPVPPPGRNQENLKYRKSSMERPKSRVSKFLVGIGMLAVSALFIGVIIFHAHMHPVKNDDEANKAAANQTANTNPEASAANSVDDQNKEQSEQNAQQAEQSSEDAQAKPQENPESQPEQSSDDSGTEDTEQPSEQDGKKDDGKWDDDFESAIVTGGNIVLDKDDKKFKFLNGENGAKSMEVEINITKGFFKYEFYREKVAGFYKGETNSKGLPHGKGTFSTVNPYKEIWTYQGEWKDGRMEGRGIRFFNSPNQIDKIQKKEYGIFREDFISQGITEEIIDDKVVISEGNFHNNGILRDGSVRGINLKGTIWWYMQGLFSYDNKHVSGIECRAAKLDKGWKYEMKDGVFMGNFEDIEYDLYSKSSYAKTWTKAHYQKGAIGKEKDMEGAPNGWVDVVDIFENEN